MLHAELLYIYTDSDLFYNIKETLIFIVSLQVHQIVHFENNTIKYYYLGLGLILSLLEKL